MILFPISQPAPTDTWSLIRQQLERGAEQNQAAGKQAIAMLPRLAREAAPGTRTAMWIKPDEPLPDDFAPLTITSEAIYKDVLGVALLTYFGPIVIGVSTVALGIYTYASTQNFDLSLLTVAVGIFLTVMFVEFFDSKDPWKQAQRSWEKLSNLEVPK